MIRANYKNYTLFISIFFFYYHRLKRLNKINVIIVFKLYSGIVLLYIFNIEIHQLNFLSVLNLRIYVIAKEILNKQTKTYSYYELLN